MKLSDDQIKLLLDRFVSSETAQAWRNQRREDNKRWTEWIDPEKIKNLSDEELKKAFLDYFNEGAGRHPFNAVYRDRIVRDMERFRKTVAFLLDETIPVNKRLDQVLERGGKYRMEGIGKGLATSFLMDLDPEKYATWNNKTDMGLNALGVRPTFDRGESWGSCYQKIMGVLSHIKSLKQGLNFLDVDHFLHIVSAEEEGIEAIKAVVEGKEIIKGVSEEIGQITDQRAKMEFAMEKYLEEFIEANFEKIDFGMDLELYQDEESNGRQYPTAIGNIDLLATNKKTKEFVVIELKKGRSGDAVVGQLLRYMGWVKENLAKDGQTVKGIIIIKDKDEKIEFALKMIPNISLFLYEVSFQLTRI